MNTGHTPAADRSASTDSHILVVYFSRTGHTDALAQQIAQGCHADVERIEYRDDHQGLLGHARAVMAGLLGGNSFIERGLRDPGRYSLVIVGTPVWFGSVPGPVQAWLRRHHSALVNVAVFCTSGSLGSTKVLDNLEGLSGRRACARLALRAHAVDHCRQEPAFQRFLLELKRVRPLETTEGRTRPLA